MLGTTKLGAWFSFRCVGTVSVITTAGYFGKQPSANELLSECERKVLNICAAEQF